MSRSFPSHPPQSPLLLRQGFGGQVGQGGGSPDKNKGQHFLVDEQVVADLVVAGRVKKGDKVIEVGPGTGVLTKALLAAGAQVTAVELDRRFAKDLEKISAQYPDQLQVVWGNILSGIEGHQSAPYKIVASLPYNISARFFKTFLWQEPLPISITVLVQAEVAERVCAKPGQMSLLSLAVQLRGTPSITRYVERASFWPQPQVRSAILNITNIAGTDKYQSLWRLARIGFSSRRKQLKNNLASGLGVTVGQVSDWLEAAGLSVKVRAQELGVEEWVRLAGEVENRN